MKKVLILAYDFPPYKTVGAMRPAGWYKYFNEFGVYPIIVTRNWNVVSNDLLDYHRESVTKKLIYEKDQGGEIIKTPYSKNISDRLLLKYGKNKFKIFRKAISAIYEIGQYLFKIGTKQNLYVGAKEYLSHNHVDAIIATGSPHILFKYASDLSKEFNTPWIADYRDPWSQSKSRSFYGLLTRWNKYFEKKYTKNSLFATTVSEFCQAQIVSNYSKPIHVIRNGYDDEVFRDNEKYKQPKTLTIAFAGTIYKWHPIEKFLSVIEELILSGHRINLKFIGVNNSDRIKTFIKTKDSLKSCIQLLPKLSGDDYVKSLSESNLLLLFNDYSLIGTKIYDYIACNREVLMCFSEEIKGSTNEIPYFGREIENISNSVQADLIKQTNSGVAIKNAFELKALLIERIKNLESEGKINCNAIDTHKLSRRFQTMLFAELIQNINATQTQKLDF
jgi:glycosyltransferase involved in cell wall biosynthesis